MHQPEYIQGGQEVGRGYLLLRIHVRRIRGIDIVLENCGAARGQGFSEADDEAMFSGGHGG